jgi:hypothetical protein
MAETKDLTIGGTVLVSDHDKPQFVMLQRSYDFAVAGNTTSAGDTLQMIEVPPGFMALGVVLETQRVETTTHTPVQVGDGGDTDGWIASANANLASTATSKTRAYSQFAGANTLTTLDAYGAQGGKFYPVADTIDVLPQDALSIGKIRVGVWGFISNPGNDTAHTLDSQ